VLSHPHNRTNDAPPLLLFPNTSHLYFSLSKEGEGTKEQEGKRRRKKIGERRSPRAAALYP